MIADGVELLTARLREDGYHVTIETAGTIWKDVVYDLASVSPKLANSTPWERDEGRFADLHEGHRICLDTVRKFMRGGDYQLKFVVSEPSDLVEIDAILAGLGEFESSNVLLMPEGVTSEALNAKGRWIADLCLDRGFRFCPRLHIFLYGNAPGT